jgi:hypothetical protein
LKGSAEWLIGGECADVDDLIRNKDLAYTSGKSLKWRKQITCNHRIVMMSCVVGQRSLDEAPSMEVTHVVHMLFPVVHGTMGSCQAQLVDESNRVQAKDMIALTNTQYTWT